MYQKTTRRAAVHRNVSNSKDGKPTGKEAEACRAGNRSGGAVAKILADSPWRVALVASSSWSHAFLTPKNHYLYPDNASDRARFDELASGKLSRWRELSTAEIEDAGQQEFLNWVCLGGAMHALGREPEIVDYVENYIFNSDKCFALFRP